jgi:hypothetical protein
MPNIKSRYLDEFVRLKCAPDLLALRIFPNAKEITESMSAYQAVVQHIVGANPRQRSFVGGGEIALDDPTVTVAIIGDGHNPRTGALFAMRSAWKVASVDPLMRPWRSGRVHRLSAFTAKVGALKFRAPGPLIIVGVHSHARLDDALAGLTSAIGVRHVVSLPCCVDQVIEGRTPDVDYDDEDSFSEARRVLVWRNA